MTAIDHDRNSILKNRPRENGKCHDLHSHSIVENCVQTASAFSVAHAIAIAFGIARLHQLLHGICFTTITILECIRETCTCVLLLACAALACCCHAMGAVDMHQRWYGSVRPIRRLLLCLATQKKASPTANHPH